MRRLLPLLTILAALAVPAAASASSKQVTTFEAPRELLSAATRDSTLNSITSLGVHNIRQLVYWRDYAPAPASAQKPSFDASNPDAYPPGTWGNLDALIGDAKAHGVSVMLTLTGPPPRWAAKDSKLSYPNAKEFGAFATAVGRRYGASVDTWSIWNEPNQPQFLLPQYVHGKPESPKIYRQLYLAAYAGLRKASPKASILIGETSPRGNEHIVAPLAFLRGTLCLSASYKKSKSCGELQANGYAHHAYTTAAGPRFKPPSKDDVTIGVLSRLTTALDKAAKAGALPKGLPIHLTEFGIQTTPDEISGVSLSQQAAYLAIAEHMAYVNPRVVQFSQYLLTDDSPRTTGYKYGGFESGLISSAGKEKPAYQGFRLPLAAEQYGASDVLWGLVRPLRARSTVTILHKLKGKGWAELKSFDTTDAGVYALRAKHASGQLYRVRWTAPDGSTYTGPPIPSATFSKRR
jgi:hypothetical protein